MKETPSTCPYCGVGCGVLIASEADRITGVRGDPQHPANKGKLCSKGATLHLSAGNAGRALYPMMRRDRDLPRQRVSWDQALDHTAEKFAQIIQNDGPDSVAFYISGQLLTEDYYVFNKLSKEHECYSHSVDPAPVTSKSMMCIICKTFQPKL